MFLEVLTSFDKFHRARVWTANPLDNRINLEWFHQFVQFPSLNEFYIEFEPFVSILASSLSFSIHLNLKDFEVISAVTLQYQIFYENVYINTRKALEDKVVILDCDGWNNFKIFTKERRSRPLQQDRGDLQSKTHLRIWTLRRSSFLDWNFTRFLTILTPNQAEELQSRPKLSRFEWRRHLIALNFAHKNTRAHKHTLFIIWNQHVCIHAAHLKARYLLKMPPSPSPLNLTTLLEWNLLSVCLILYQIIFKLQQ